MRSGVCHAARRLQRAAGSVEAFHFCRAERWPIVEAPTHLEPVPGLYAIHAAEEAWSELGLEHRRDVPLYVGMSRSSLVTRELGQHFEIEPEVPARTGGQLFGAPSPLCFASRCSCAECLATWTGRNGQPTTA